MTRHTLFFLVLWGVLIPAPWALCPGECQCDNTRLVVNCTGVFLADLPMTLNPHIKSMKITHAGLEKIDSNMQFYPDLIAADLSHNKIGAIPPYAFENQGQLSRLNLEFNRINALYKESLEGLTNLIKLDLGNNKLGHLSGQIFQSLDRLQHLDLSANNLATVSKNAFDGLEDTLITLNLEQNKLVSTPIDSLINLNHLSDLSLAYNSLKRLQMARPTAEAKMSSLKRLDLSFTRAERTNICQLLDLAPQLDHLVYLGNSVHQLACIENNDIKELDLGYTDVLVNLDPAVFYSMSRLKKLSVSNAPQLSAFAIDTLMANTRLEEINITSNAKLTSISLEVFSHLPSLRILNLSNNSLTAVKPIEGTRFDQLDLLDISENPLDCNCTSKALIVSGVKPNKLVCYTHKDDVGSKLTSTLFGDITCLTPFTIKLAFLSSLSLLLVLLFSISLAVQAFNHKRKQRGDPISNEHFESTSLLLSFPTSSVVSSAKSNAVSDLATPTMNMLEAWPPTSATSAVNEVNAYVTASRSLDNLDLKDHRDLEEYVNKRFYSGSGHHYATLMKPSIAYISGLTPGAASAASGEPITSQQLVAGAGSEAIGPTSGFYGGQGLVQNEVLFSQPQTERPAACDCVGHFHHSQHQLYY